MISPSHVVAPSNGVHESLDALRRTAVFVGFGAGLALVNRLTGFGITCPFRAMTGHRCPLCGGTTMGSRLWGLDLVGAWQANAFLLCAVVVLGVCVLVWSAEVVLGRRLWPSRWPGSLDHWLLFGAVVGTVFGIVRELG